MYYIVILGGGSSNRDNSDEGGFHFQRFSNERDSSEVELRSPGIQSDEAEQPQTLDPGALTFKHLAKSEDSNSFDNPLYNKESSASSDAKVKVEVEGDACGVGNPVFAKLVSIDEGNSGIAENAEIESKNAMEEPIKDKNQDEKSKEKEETTENDVKSVEEPSTSKFEKSDEDIVVQEQNQESKEMDMFLGSLEEGMSPVEDIKEPEQIPTQSENKADTDDKVEPLLEF